MSDWTDVAALAEFAPGETRSLEVEGTLIAVVNLDGEFYAIEDVCTHDGGRLTGGPLFGDVIVCPRHGARFSVKTGEVLAPPAYEPVAIFPVRVESGWVQVRDDRWD
ncbi:MAG: non-heme iron oxygenase ferredoxin subunit [Burkholderiales bacterium]|nr:non-heme iron oxygenase ferredoxin subunit [Burkholderiales bacterium]MDQ3195413.1 non-heme iron oxygenase ferredoxin subunit [Pseudomonadota bacterium]